MHTVGKTSAGVNRVYASGKSNKYCGETMEQLKKEGLWFACADMKGLDYFDTNMKGAIGIVIGSEGDGVSRLVKKKIVILQ